MGKFDSLGIEVDKPSRLELVHPYTFLPMKDAEGNPAYIDVYSTDSEIKRKHDREIDRRNMESRGRMNPAKLAEQRESDFLDLLARLTSGWHLVGLDGTKLDVPFSQENARELYAHPKMLWIREQVAAQALDRANFVRASSAS